MNFNLDGKTLKLEVNFYGAEDFMGAKKRVLYLGLIDEYECPYTTITTCFGEFIGQMFSSYIDTNNNPWAEKFLTDNNIGKKTAFTKRSEWCEYPLYIINPTLMREILGDDVLLEYLMDFDFYGENKPWEDFEEAVKAYNNI